MSQAAGAVIREARRRSGLSQAELARRAKVSQPVISAYESGRREPSFSMLAKLVEASGHQLSLELVPDPASPPDLPDTPMGRRLRRHRRAIIAAGEQRGVTNVRVFGSVARAEDRDDSDIDLLVDAADGVSLIDLIGLERELAGILKRPVDVVAARMLKPGVAARVVVEAVPL